MTNQHVPNQTSPSTTADRHLDFAHPAFGRRLSPRVPAAGTGVRAIGLLVALWCVAFATVNVVYEANGHFQVARFAQYAHAIEVMSWVVIVLKIIGAAVAVAVISRVAGRALIATTALLVWGAFGVLAIYTLGNLTMLAGIVLGIVDDTSALSLRNLAYVSFFAVGAAGYGVLAVSFTRRSRVRRIAVAGGLLGAPALLAVLLVVLPKILGVAG